MGLGEPTTVGRGVAVAVAVGVATSVGKGVEVAVGVAVGGATFGVEVGVGVSVGDSTVGVEVGVELAGTVGVAVAPAPVTCTTPFIMVPPGTLWRVQ